MTDLNIKTDADSYVDSANPDVNYFDYGSLWVSRNSSGVITRIPFFNFPISASIPASSIINSGILYLYVGSANYFYDTCPAYNCAASWAEGTITWNNKPATSGASIGNIPMNSTGWKTLDITSLVQDWLDGVVNNYGIQILPDAENKTTSFYSKEVGESYRAYIATSYTPPAGGGYIPRVILI